ncbi:E3 ubiquitin-protein ligase RNF220a isoform X1 [Mastacembelus armatus]|uniref:E3 ubiquitin-protein ligase RNF220a isoform X1 n=1 Tax=Mastacembelus armatus TaxID=205130 RepID=UPI000E45C434|nr:E3 ubiquitin-protein ligase Rnf220-like isoform X1 [Mastacembelus armatus]XP_026170330.1 E3 ubiquitin-protein ligase Rnf220-like isoform X1 [Mastacembelus armatus]
MDLHRAAFKMESSSYLPNPLASPALMVLASTAEASRDASIPCQQPRPFGVPVSVEKDVHLPFNNGSYTFASMYHRQGAVPPGFPNRDFPPSLLHLHHQFAPPNLDCSPISMLNHSGVGAFRPFASPPEDRDGAPGGYQSAFTPAKRLKGCLDAEASPHLRYSDAEGKEYDFGGAQIPPGGSPSSALKAVEDSGKKIFAVSGLLSDRENSSSPEDRIERCLSQDVYFKLADADDEALWEGNDCRQASRPHLSTRYPSSCSVQLRHEKWNKVSKQKGKKREAIGKKKMSLYDSQAPVCPICQVLLRPGELQEHMETEIERLATICLSKNPSPKDGAATPGTPKSMLLSVHIKREGESPVVSPLSSEDAHHSDRYQTFLRVRANRQTRLNARIGKMKRRKPEEGGQVCPLCSAPLAGSEEEMSRHVEQCLIQREGALGDEDSADMDENVRGFEEYEWAGQKRIRATALLEGGFRGTGFATCSIKESSADSDADLDVDGDDTLEYGKAQYTEADIIPCSGAGEDQGEAREREALRGAVLNGGMPSNRITPEFSKWASDEMPSTSNGESSKTDPSTPSSSSSSSCAPRTCKNSEIEKVTEEESTATTMEALKARIRELEKQILRGDRYKCLICMRKPAIQSGVEIKSLGAWPGPRPLANEVGERQPKSLPLGLYCLYRGLVIGGYGSGIKRLLPQPVRRDSYTMPLTSIQCWHVHCEECWLRTLGNKKLCPQCNTITSPGDLRRVYL